MENRYKIYYGGSKIKLPNYILRMYTQEAGSSCPVATGGLIRLPNNDILYINEQNGEIHSYDPGMEGIELTLESGHEFISYLLKPQTNSVQQSGYGVFFDFNDLYYDGNIIKIYDLGNDGLYDVQEMFWREKYSVDYGKKCTAVIKLDGDTWVLTDEPMFIGNSVTLNSGEEIWVNGPSYCDNELGIFFTRDSGDGCYAYYKRNGNLLNETSNFWFGSPCYPQDGDTITIYGYSSSDDYDSALNWSQDYSESNVSNYLSKLCVLWFDESVGEWQIDEDYS